MVKNNIVLMSGKGQRFKDEGYKIPKPLIDLHGKPIIEKVINNFPNTDKWIFTVNKEVYEHETFIKFYEKFNLNKTILLLDEVTNGQATSCLKSLDLVPSGEDFFVGSCDAIFKNKIILNKNSKVDSLVFTTYPKEEHKENANNYGWVIGEKKVKNIFCKETPDRVNDSFLIAGSFYFKNKSLFHKIYKQMVENKMFINNELYIDTMFEILHNQNYNLENLLTEIDIIGTPKEYASYSEGLRDD
tara:strand:- start:4342 stop:5073 length:732 start_codon:yes stop_codon:yes gene_type:complete